jgi:alpha-tubulin suppressor-like RCC1 family protein
VEIGAGGDYSCARTTTGEVWCWGNAQPVPGWPETQRTPAKVALSAPARSLAIGRRHACVVDHEGRAHCWGWNVDGETGTGASGLEASMVAAPTPVETDARFTMLSAGLGTTCGVTVEGGVLCWGSNIDGILGPDAPDRCGDVGPIPCATRPVRVAIPVRVQQVSAGSSHACALGETGVLYCWGANSAGQVGAYGAGVPLVRTPSAVALPRSGSFVSVSSGGLHTCALATTRRVYCWGSDQLNFGDELEEAAVAPRVAAGGTQFMAISTGMVHACGLDTRGRLLCWGNTILGALGVR